MLKGQDHAVRARGPRARPAHRRPPRKSSPRRCHHTRDPAVSGTQAQQHSSSFEPRLCEASPSPAKSATSPARPRAGLPPRAPGKWGGVPGSGGYGLKGTGLNHPGTLSRGCEVGGGGEESRWASPSAFQLDPLSPACREHRRRGLALQA